MKRFCFLPGVIGVLLGLIVDLSAQVVREPGEVVFCAYNVKNYLKMQRFVDGQRTEGVGKPEREIKAVVKFLTEINADVVGLTEIGSKEDLEDLRSRLKKNGIDYPHVEHAHGGDPVRCQGLLSKLPIVARDSQKSLTYKLGEVVFPLQRGILDVTLQTAGGARFRCMGVHLKSKREVPEADESLMRRNEAALLRQHVEAVLVKAPETELLVYGDFNENSHEAPMVELRGRSRAELSLSDVKLVDTRGQTWTYYWAAADVYSRFDYVLANRALMKRVNMKSSYVYDVPDFLTGSDHRPVVVKLGFGDVKK
ncbi:endonuclease/exonuclease/phosphatase family protein [Phragmitibacter flavus]|uniref:Endonuclease/exonuclease/phosphatase family protein n=1 Tax=Phragmitibacter flavus TaxID=2576071 RepID=A0A5R8KGJ8_9BACT|nr:endonuclease/exonuclease/phosphatase family protein [Phragmitibacter flavus]TLD70719.1 endonuclease/exonuclease/phosphatase family protein [Phragmitibacter flavus]